jgi:hypothetical protein
VGPASLTFRADASLPAGVSQLDFSRRAHDRGAAAVAADGGVLFDCACGAPLWIDAAYAGRLGKCKYCGTVAPRPQAAGPARLPAAEGSPPRLTATSTASAATALPATAFAVTATATATAPQPPARAATGAAPPGAAAGTCGACQSAIDAEESSTACPSCGLTFHADCWAENYGCSAYGCSMVNALLPPPASDAPRPGRRRLRPAHSFARPRRRSGRSGRRPSPRVPAEHALLAGAVAGVLVGALTFGVPALVALVATLLYLRRRRGRGDARARRIALAAAVLAGVGVMAGVAVSYVWWVAGTPSDAVRRDIGVWSEGT